MRISMHITCDDHTMQHALNCKHYHESLASDSDIEFNAYCINQTKSETHQRLLNDGFRVHVVNNQIGRGSMQHAIALNQAILMFNKEHINIICDADTAALKRGWDNDVRTLHEKFDCIGIQNPDDVLRHDVRTPQQTWLGTPVPQWVSFKNGIDWSQLDSTPDKMNQDPKNNVSKKQERDIFGLDYADRSLLKDTMWKLPLMLYERKLTSFVFDGPFWHKTPQSKVFYGLTGLNTEDEFQFGGTSILTHGRCCRKDGKDPFWQAVESYVKML